MADGTNKKAVMEGYNNDRLTLQAPDQTTEVATEVTTEVTTEVGCLVVVTDEAMVFLVIHKKSARKTMRMRG